MNIFKSIGDRLLAFFIPEIKAGACVPEHGQSCGHFNCNGICV